MKIGREILNSITFEFKNDTIISFWQEWYQFFDIKKYNWCNINFLQIQFEYDRQCGHYEFVFVLLGLGIRIMIPHETKKSKKFMKELHKRKDEIFQSCEGLVEKRRYDLFKKNKITSLNVYAVDKGYSKKMWKKIFIQ